MNEALWALGRGTGVAALISFTLAVLLGILNRSGRPLGALGRTGAADLHRTAALTGVGLVVLHVVTLAIDPFAQLRLVDLAVPFLGIRSPLWLGLGTLALDLLVVVTAVSLLRHRVGPAVFRFVHWATYPLWALSLAHALGTGSDARTSAGLSLAAACSLAVVAAVLWRTSESYAGRGWSRRPRLRPGAGVNP